MPRADLQSARVLLCFLAVGRDFVMRIFLSVTVTIFDAVEFVGRVVFCDFPFIIFAVVELFSDDGPDGIELSRLGSRFVLVWEEDWRHRNLFCGLHPWSCDTLLHPWSWHIIILLVDFIIIILVEVE